MNDHGDIQPLKHSRNKDAILFRGNRYSKVFDIVQTQIRASNVLLLPMQLPLALFGEKEFDHEPFLPAWKARPYECQSLVAVRSFKLGVSDRDPTDRCTDQVHKDVAIAE